MTVGEDEAFENDAGVYGGDAERVRAGLRDRERDFDLLHAVGDCGGPVLWGVVLEDVDDLAGAVVDGDGEAQAAARDEVVAGREGEVEGEVCGVVEIDAVVEGGRGVQ